MNRCFALASNVLKCKGLCGFCLGTIEIKMVEAAGIEANSLPCMDLPGLGQTASKAGQKASQPGQAQDVASESGVELGTGAQGQPVESRTLEEHKISIKLPEGFENLSVVIEAWELLPLSFREEVFRAAKKVLASRPDVAGDIAGTEISSG